MRQCNECKNISLFVATHEFNSVCTNCGFVDSFSCESGTLFGDYVECPNVKETTYKYDAHWQEHLKAFNCEDPPIPPEIATIIRLECEIFRSKLRRYPNCKRDIKKILQSIELPNIIGDKYIKKRKFNVHRRYYERWHTILTKMCGTKIVPMPPELRRSMTSLFANFCVHFVKHREYIKRKSMFSLDFIFGQFMKHIDANNLVDRNTAHFNSVFDNGFFTYYEKWLALPKKTNPKTLNQYKFICTTIGIPVY